MSRVECRAKVSGRLTPAWSIHGCRDLARDADARQFLKLLFQADVNEAASCVVDGARIPERRIQGLGRILSEDIVATNRSRRVIEQVLPEGYGVVRRSLGLDGFTVFGSDRQKQKTPGTLIAFPAF
jgi:hypothetical protein